jgi:ribA/ribD-fused uncharacterized protein
MTQQYDLKWLREKFDKDEHLKYIFFWGHTRKHNEGIGKYCFSQWYELPFIIDNITYPTAEHWMMAGKARLFNDTTTFERIISAEKPGAAKDLGRNVLNFDEKTWNENRFELVVKGNVHKFGQHPEYSDYLLKTGDRILVEASPLDKIWGIGLPEDAEDARNPHHWRGLNLLGFALMAAREILRR